MRLGLMSVAGVMSASGSLDDVTEPSPGSPGVWRPSSSEETSDEPAQGELSDTLLHDALHYITIHYSGNT